MFLVSIRKASLRILDTLNTTFGLSFASDFISDSDGQSRNSSNPGSFRIVVRSSINSFDWIIRRSVADIGVSVVRVVTMVSWRLSSWN